MHVTDFLDEAGVSYQITEHPPAFTAQQMAAAEHEPGKYVAKPVIVKADGDYLMCVLPAPCKVDLKKLKDQLNADKIEIADENTIGKLCGDCDLGAEPPLGNLYNMPTIIDKALEGDDHITFQAGAHDKAIHMTMADYRKLVAPTVLDFGYHVTT